MTTMIDKEIVREAVVQTLLSFGIDVSAPEAIVHFQQDMHHLRSLRLQSEMNKSNALRKLTDLVLSGLAAAVLLGIGQYLGIFRSM